MSPAKSVTSFHIDFAGSSGTTAFFRRSALIADRKFSLLSHPSGQQNLLLYSTDGSESTSVRTLERRRGETGERMARRRCRQSREDRIDRWEYDDHSDGMDSRCYYSYRLARHWWELPFVARYCKSARRLLDRVDDEGSQEGEHFLPTADVMIRVVLTSSALIVPLPAIHPTELARRFKLRHPTPFPLPDHSATSRHATTSTTRSRLPLDIPHRTSISNSSRRPRLSRT